MKKISTIILFLVCFLSLSAQAQSARGVSAYSIVSAEHLQYDEEGQEVVKTTPIFYESGAKIFIGISNVSITYTYNGVKSIEILDVAEGDDTFEIDFDMNTIYKFTNGSKGVLDPTSKTFTIEVFKDGVLSYSNVIYLKEDNVVSDRP